MPSRRHRGCHRKSTVSCRLTAIGVVGFGAAAVGMLAPTAAHAATTATDAQWDRVAHCESDGEWHINTGNGYYGGLQFAASTWSSFDDNHYASRADLATREQQIDVANHVLAREGWNAWPVCSRDAGPAGSPSTAHERRHAKSRHRHTLQSRHEKPVRHHTRHYVVRRGDSLSSIARHHHVKGGWRALYKRNRTVIGPDPEDLRIGMRLAL